MYLANSGRHVAGASRYGQHLQRMVTSQYLCVVAVTVYVLLISTSSVRFDVPLARVTFLNSVVNFLNSIVNLNNSRPSSDNP